MATPLSVQNGRESWSLPELPALAVAQPGFNSRHAAVIRQAIDPVFQDLSVDCCEQKKILAQYDFSVLDSALTFTNVVSTLAAAGGAGLITGLFGGDLKACLASSALAGAITETTLTAREHKKTPEYRIRDSFNSAIANCCNHNDYQTKLQQEALPAQARFNATRRFCDAQAPHVDLLNEHARLLKEYKEQERTLRWDAQISKYLDARKDMRDKKEKSIELSVKLQQAQQECKEASKKVADVDTTKKNGLEKVREAQKKVKECSEHVEAKQRAANLAQSEWLLAESKQKNRLAQLGSEKVLKTGRIILPLEQLQAFSSKATQWQTVVGTAEMFAAELRESARHDMTVNGSRDVLKELPKEYRLPLALLPTQVPIPPDDDLASRMGALKETAV